MSVSVVELLHAQIEVLHPWHYTGESQETHATRMKQLLSGRKQNLRHSAFSLPPVCCWPPGIQRNLVQSSSGQGPRDHLPPLVLPVVLPYPGGCRQEGPSPWYQVARCCHGWGLVARPCHTKPCCLLLLLFLVNRCHLWYKRDLQSSWSHSIVPNPPVWRIGNEATSSCIHDNYMHTTHARGSLDYH